MQAQTFFFFFFYLYPTAAQGGSSTKEKAECCSLNRALRQRSFTRCVHFHWAARDERNTHLYWSPQSRQVLCVLLVCVCVCVCVFVQQHLPELGYDWSEDCCSVCVCVCVCGDYCCFAWTPPAPESCPCSSHIPQLYPSLLLLLLLLLLLSSPLSYLPNVFHPSTLFFMIKSIQQTPPTHHHICASRCKSVLWLQSKLFFFFSLSLSLLAAAGTSASLCVRWYLV